MSRTEKVIEKLKELAILKPEEFDELKELSAQLYYGGCRRECDRNDFPDSGFWEKKPLVYGNDHCTYVYTGESETK